jgi:hypothetical protein
MKFFLNTIITLSIFLKSCVGKNTFSFYNLDEAFKQINTVLNYSNVAIDTPKYPQQDLEAFYLNLKSAKYSSSNPFNFSNVSSGCVNKISQFFESLKNKEMWTIQSIFF